MSILKIRSNIILNIILMLSTSGMLFSQKYRFQEFYPADQSIPSYIYAVSQDKSGFLWIADGKGLFRFNGFHFKNYKIPSPGSGDFITSLFNDNENLWCGTNEGFIYYYDGQVFHPINQGGKRYSRINHFLISPGGALWAATNENGLIRIDQKTKISKEYPTEESLAIKSFGFLKENEIIIGTNAGLHHYQILQSGELRLIAALDNLPRTPIISIVKRRENGGFYVATENSGIYKLTQDNEKLNISSLKTINNETFDRVQDILEDFNKDVWLATFGQGLIRLSIATNSDPADVTCFNKKSGFVTDNVKTIFEDREGNIWTGNFGDGISRVQPVLFSFIPLNDRLYGTQIFSIWPDSENLWLGTEKGLLRVNRVTMTIAEFFSSGKGLPQDTVMTLFSNNERVLWIGTSNHGVYQMDIKRGEIKRSFTETDVLKNSVVKITGNKDKIWIGTKKGLQLIDLKNDSVSWFSINEGGLPHNIIHDIYLDSKNKLWITTKSSILSYIENSRITKIPLYSKKAIMSLGTITEDESSTIWVGSNGSGIFIINEDSVFNLSEEEGLLSNYCYSLAADSQNNLWIAHKKGFSKVDISDLFIRRIENIYGTPEEIRFNLYAQAYDSGKQLYFGTNKGLLVYDQDRKSGDSPSPILNITSIKVNDKLIKYNNGIELPPGNYTIQINFLGINMKAPEEVSYQHKLEGYNDWSGISHDTSVTYTQVTNGQYKFILQSSNEEGIITDNPVILDIRIKKPIWKIWWFYLVIFLFISLINFLHLKKRERIILEEKYILEKKVIERTHEIQVQKDEIEKQRDLIKEKNSSITSSIIYASYIQDAIISSHSFFDKKFSENFILSMPKDIVSGDFYWMAEKNGKIIFTVADGTGHGVPGAFISLLGITFLDEIVNTLNITNSKQIITILRERVIQTLTQRSKNNPTPDGMDMTLCVLDEKSKTIQYSGAMSDMLLIQNGKMKLFKGNRQSVCIPLTKKREFNMEVIHYAKGDMLYLFTDGYKDQFGGPNDKKYLARRFYSRLMEIYSEPTPIQKEILEKRLRDWMGQYPQTDDITVIGIRL